MKFQSKVDQVGKLYLPKSLRDAGMTKIIEIQPNTFAAVIYRKGTPLKHVLESIHIITMDLEHQLKTKAEA